MFGTTRIRVLADLSLFSSCTVVVSKTVCRSPMARCNAYNTAKYKAPSSVGSLGWSCVIACESRAVWNCLFVCLALFVHQRVQGRRRERNGTTKAIVKSDMIPVMCWWYSICSLVRLIKQDTVWIYSLNKSTTWLGNLKYFIRIKISHGKKKAQPLLSFEVTSGHTNLFH